MTKMKHLERATVESPNADSYPDVLVQGRDDPGIQIDWPLEKALVVVNGSNATINIPKYGDDGLREKMVRFDRLTEVTVVEGKPNGKPVTITGVSSYLTQIVRVPHDEAQVTMVVKDWGRCDTC